MRWERNGRHSTLSVLRAKTLMYCALVIMNHSLQNYERTARLTNNAQSYNNYKGDY